MTNVTGAKFYYNLSDSLGEVAAKTAADSNYLKFATPKDTFTIHNYYADADANYEYIAPRTSNDYGGWASYTYHAIAQDRFYYKNSSSNTYTSFKFVHKLSAPLVAKSARSSTQNTCQAPFNYTPIFPMGVQPNSSGYGAKIYWDNAKNAIQVKYLNRDGTITVGSENLWQGYGVFILLSGAGGGGGGGDKEIWAQGHPGGGGGGGGGTALIYFDAKEAYDNYKDCYLWITVGKGGKGGKGGSGFTAGSAGVDSVATLKTSSGTTMCTITCAGGRGGAGHAWDAAADSAGGNGGAVTTSFNGGQYASTLQYLKLVDSVSGGKGGAGKRGANGNYGATVADGSWKFPFTDSWKKTEAFGPTTDLCIAGAGSTNNWQGGGGGGCSTGYVHDNSKTKPYGHGMGGYGGGKAQAGLAGLDGFCGIFYNYITGRGDCEAKTVS